ncbi:MAG: Ubiquinone biosynthesis O-methyltransferase [Anaerolineales bacterium]|nr:Ubiquinone biosynthesis O-methyltransferase [Anaerolineales bacterium]
MNLARLRFALRYLHRPPWDSGIVPPELRAYIASHPAGRALDLGCGTGTNVAALAQVGWQVTGVDFVPRAISLAKQKLRAADLTADLRVGDVTNLRGIAGPFELALDIGCFHGVEDKSAYLNELERLLAPAGDWLVYGFFKPASHPSGPGLDEADVGLILARGFGLITRTDGFDRRERPSAWFLFQRMK